MRQLEITISPVGETKIEAKGFTGTSCRDATQKYEDALGISQARVAKPEMWQENQQRKKSRSDQVSDTHREERGKK